MRIPLSRCKALAYHLIVGKVERDIGRYNEVCAKRQEAGRRGAAARWQNAQNEEPEKWQSIANDGKRIFEMANDGKHANQNQSLSQNVTQAQDVTQTGTISSPQTPLTGMGNGGEEKAPRWEEVVEYARMQPRWPFPSSEEKCQLN